jgi:hypothetical protein
MCSRKIRKDHSMENMFERFFVCTQCFHYQATFTDCDQCGKSRLMSASVYVSLITMSYVLCMVHLCVLAHTHLCAGTHAHTQRNAPKSFCVLAHIHLCAGIQPSHTGVPVRIPAGTPIMHQVFLCAGTHTSVCWHTALTHNAMSQVPIAFV